MSVIEPWGLDAGSDGMPEYAGADFRALMSGLLAPGDGVLNGRTGVLTGLGVSASGNTVTVKPGVCIVNTTMKGSYWSGLKEAVILPVDAGHATYERRDLIVCMVEDLAASGRGSEVKIIKGTPSASPAVPGTPTNACAIGIITVPSSGAISVMAAPQKSALAGPEVERHYCPNLESRVPTRLELTRVGNIVVANPEKDVATQGITPEKWNARLWEIPEGWRPRTRVFNPVVLGGKLCCTYFGVNGNVVFYNWEIIPSGTQFAMSSATWVL